MKTYSTGEVMSRRQIDGMDSEEWAPAEVAQGLYEVLKAMVDYADDVDPCFPGLGKARAALAAADGEEV